MEKVAIYLRIIRCPRKVRIKKAIPLPLQPTRGGIVCNHYRIADIPARVCYRNKENGGGASIEPIRTALSMVYSFVWPNTRKDARAWVL